MTEHAASARVSAVLAIVLITVVLATIGSPVAGAACAPRVDLALESIRDATDAVDRINVRVTAASTVAGGDRLVRVRFGSIANAEIRIGGATQPVPSTVTLPAGVSSWTFTVSQTRDGEPFLANFVVTGLCGDVAKFAGAGREAVRPKTTPPPPPPPPSCSSTLQQLVNAAPSGSTLTVPACIFRESVTISKPLTLVASAGAEIRGSDVWTAWTRSGGLWSAPGVPSFVGHGECRAGTGDRCRRREQVFLDGQPLVQVASNPQPGQFAIANASVYLADDPNGRTVEVSTRSFWVLGAAPDVTVRGFTMRHAASDAQQGAISNGGHSRWTMQENDLLDAHGAGVSLSGGSDHRLLRNTISRHGHEGVHMTGTTDALIQGNAIQGNNTEGFNPEWEAGGLKATVSTRLTLDGNDVSQNDGPGLWCDINCRDAIIINNRVYSNQRAGIFFEISDGARIADNVVWENGWGFTPWGWGGGIVVSTSRNVQVTRNTMAWNADGIAVIEQDRGPSYAVTNVTVNDNLIASAQTSALSFALAWLTDTDIDNLHAPASANGGGQNAYWAPTPDTGTVQFGWTDDLNLLSAFNATPGEEGGRYLTTAEKNQALSAKGVPTTPIAR